MIGIYGGTFDPVHYGHLRTAWEVAEQLGLTRMLMLPARTPPHRDAPSADAMQRSAMLALALRGQDRLTIDDRELRREGPSYMVDTLRSLREEFPSDSLCLVLGCDAFNGLESWHEWEMLTELAHIVVMTRPDCVLPEEGAVARMLAEKRVKKVGQLAAANAGHVLLCEVRELAISASAIRDIIGAGGDPRYLLPNSVWEFIQAQELYRANPKPRREN